MDTEPTDRYFYPKRLPIEKYPNKEHTAKKSNHTSKLISKLLFLRNSSFNNVSNNFTVVFSSYGNDFCACEDEGPFLSCKMEEFNDNEQLWRLDF